MNKFLYFTGTTVGGWAGWAIGERFGMFTALFLSLIGTAFGLYAARSFSRRFLP